MNITLKERTPSREEYIRLRKSVGWKILDDKSIEVGLKNSLYCICLEYNHSIIGFGRIIGDSGTVFYIQDIMVDPKFQGMKLGSKIMNALINHIKTNYSKEAIIGLIAFKDLDKFYKSFGFHCSENNGFYRLS